MIRNALLSIQLFDLAHVEAGGWLVVAIFILQTGEIWGRGRTLLSIPWDPPTPVILQLIVVTRFIYGQLGGAEFACVPGMATIGLQLRILRVKKKRTLPSRGYVTSRCVS